MKKYFYLVAFVFIVTSCTEAVQFNNPAFQTLKDNVFWRAISYKAYINVNGNVVVEGVAGYEKIMLQTAGAEVQTYILGVDEVSKGGYTNTLESQLGNFSTGAGIGSGQIVITEYNTKENTISGTFKLTAVNLDESDVEKPKVSLTEGVFYKVSIDPSGSTNL
jgi:hypothetical protein